MLESVKASNFAKSRTDAIAKKAHKGWERETECGYGKTGTTEVDCLWSNWRKGLNWQRSGRCKTLLWLYKRIPTKAGKSLLPWQLLKVTLSLFFPTVWKETKMTTEVIFSKQWGSSHSLSMKLWSEARQKRKKEKKNHYKATWKFHSSNDL